MLIFNAPSRQRTPWQLTMSSSFRMTLFTILYFAFLLSLVPMP